MNPLAHEHIQQWVSRIDLSDPAKLADFAAAMTTADGQELQKVLECEGVEARLVLALTLLSKERELAKLQQEIKKQVEEKISEQQRKYFLQEQYKSIRNVRPSSLPYPYPTSPTPIYIIFLTPTFSPPIYSCFLPLFVHHIPPGAGHGQGRQGGTPRQI